MKRFFNFDKETGIAKVEVMKKGIKGTGYAKIHPEDSKYATSFTGLQLAELRATKKFLEKRSRRKLRTSQAHLNHAEHFKQLAQEDADEAKVIDTIIEQIISDKAALYEKLGNPLPRVQWTELTEDLLSTEFKQGLGVNVIEGETSETVD
jgi:hypothetical protein